jgi:hypothetical protein
MTSSFLGSIAGTVLGTMIAQNFLGGHGLAGSDLGHAHGMDVGHDAGADTGDMGGGFDDIGSGFDGGSIDV